jgi:TIR domain
MSVISKSQLGAFKDSTRTFSKSVNESLDEYSRETKQGKITIFLSHKHDEAAELNSSIGLLKSFGVEIYVDWLDIGMPKTTSGKTAVRIKEKIKENKKFIFLGTEGAISSKWCNWELGYGDSLKYKKNIALLPVKNDGYSYTGSEYMEIYPSIEYLDGSRKNNAGDYISKGYYVLDPADDNGSRTFISLKQWLTQ